MAKLGRMHSPLKTLFFSYLVCHSNLTCAPNLYPHALSPAPTCAPSGLRPMTISIRLCWTSGSVLPLPLAVPEVHTDEEMIASCDSDTCRAEGGCRHPALLLLWEALVSLARYSGKGKVPESAAACWDKSGISETKLAFKMEGNISCGLEPVRITDPGCMWDPDDSKLGLDDIMAS